MNKIDDIVIARAGEHPASLSDHGDPVTVSPCHRVTQRSGLWDVNTTDFTLLVPLLGTASIWDATFKHQGMISARAARGMSRI